METHTYLELDESDEETNTLASRLLNIQDRPWDNSSHQSNKTANTKVSNPSIQKDGGLGESLQAYYTPKFMEIFKAYEHDTKIVDIGKNLLIICLENVIEFSTWARESIARSTWIRTTLEDHPDLRPEVRNGLALIKTNSGSR